MQMTTLSHSVIGHETGIERLSLLQICLNNASGCRGKDYFDGNSAIMFMTGFVAQLLARFNLGDSHQPRGNLA